MSLGMDTTSPPAVTGGEQGFRDLNHIFKSVRSQIEDRRRQQLERVNKAERSIASLVASIDRSQIEVTVTVGRRTTRVKKPMPDLAVVKGSVATFGEDNFSLDDLVARVVRDFPNHQIARETISKRLHDLKRKRFVVLVPNSAVDPPLNRRYYRLYRRTSSGPPSA